MEILNYCESGKQTSTVATFSVYIPAWRLTFHKMRLIRAKNGNMFLGFPSYSTDGLHGNKLWHSYVELSEEKAKEFNNRVLEALKPFVKE